MSTSAMKILCRYQYDPLDRLTGLKPAEHVGTQRFYQNDELVNEIEGQVELTILRHEAQPLAQRLHIANVTETTLLATDQQRSILHTLAGTDTQRMTYTAYGHRPAKSGLSSLLGFNGERPDPITRHYLLGQGNRAFNPVLMRFNNPDELSPFGDGGINAYAYCGGDPVNRYDPSGNIALYRFWDTLTIRPPIIIRPREQQWALDLSLPRTTSQSPQRVAGPSSELLQPSGANPHSVATSTVEGPGYSRAAQLPPEKRQKNPHPRNNSPTPEQIFGRRTAKKLRNQARKWDAFVKRHPDTFIDADLKWHNLLDQAENNLALAKKNPNTKSSLSSLTSTVSRHRKMVKRDALENLKYWRIETQRIREQPS